MMAAALLLFAMTASADDCTSSDAPAAYYGYACDEGGDPVCEAVGTGSSTPTIECDLWWNGETHGATAWAVHNYNGTGKDFSIWGIDGSNTGFCCAFDDDPNEFQALNLAGTKNADTLRYRHAATDSDLDNPSGSDWFEPRMEGRGGDDDMHGSATTTTDYRDRLDGGDDNDEIRAHAYLTRVHGNDGDDVIFGGDYGDELLGDDGNDLITGNDGDDDIGGLLGADTLLGSAGDDTIRGGNGDDDICGGLGDDSMWGGENSDSIFGGPGANDIARGEDGYDYCNADTEFTCEGKLAACPP